MAKSGLWPGMGLVTDKVLTPKGVKSIHKVDYNSDVKIRRFVKPPLNPNHSRFFLVDDGISRNHFDWESGGVAKFHANFEKIIRTSISKS